MSRLSKIIVALFMLVATSMNVFAADAAKPNSKVLNPWTDCGIGAMIFSNYPVAAVISNVIWDLGTTAVTSNMSSQNTCDGVRAKTAMLIGTSYANLEEETAKGSGQHLSAMLTMLSCDPTAHHDIIRSVRSEFSQSLRNVAYASKTVLEKSQAYYDLVQSKVGGEFAAQCKAI